MSSITIVWFRRDLRLRDNPALAFAAKSGRVLPVYIREAEAGDGGASQWWLDRSLRALESTIRDKGGALLVLKGDPLRLLPELARKVKASGVAWNRLYDPDTVPRDKKIKAALESRGLSVNSFNGSLLYEPWTVQTGSGTPFKVFTPFWRKASQVEPDVPAGSPRSIRFQSAGKIGVSIDSLELRPRIRWDAGLEKTWTPGEKGGQAALRRFLRSAAVDYDRSRDIPGVSGTSKLSPFLHFGELSVHRAWSETMATSLPPKDKDRYLTELGWRDFGHHLLFHFPKTANQELYPKYRNFPWRTSAKDLRAWQRGRTGFPIVDAGMRELWSTGWMHNRVRMIVSSVLVKHFGLNWRRGAEWFWDTLVDADAAANTMGWQWAAGCGADAAPYFRVFNPILQGEKFDPKGEYVRRWIPELKSVPDRFLHKPWEAAEPPVEYPRPVIAHDAGRARALGLYEIWRKG